VISREEFEKGIEVMEKKTEEKGVEVIKKQMGCMYVAKVVDSLVHDQCRLLEMSQESL